MMKPCTALWFCVVASTISAQSPPTNNVLTRMTMVESRYGRGSMFSIDIDHREYWITAKHILTGAEHPPYGSVSVSSASLKVLDPWAREERWLSVNFSVLDAGKDIDIVVLVPPNLLLTNPLPSVATYDSVMLGSDCEFLGFPYGGGWRATDTNGASMWFPYVKRCAFSGVPKSASTEDHVFVLDGINNKGFSGGPVVIHTGDDQKIVGVISGYQTEIAEVVPSTVPRKRPAPPGRQTVNLNSGFIIAYPVSTAVEAIRKNPIGPLRP